MVWILLVILPLALLFVHHTQLPFLCLGYTTFYYCSPTRFFYCRPMNSSSGGEPSSNICYQTPTTVPPAASRSDNLLNILCMNRPPHTHHRRKEEEGHAADSPSPYLGEEGKVPTPPHPVGFEGFLCFCVFQHSLFTCARLLPVDPYFYHLQLNFIDPSCPYTTYSSWSYSFWF